MGLVGGTLGEDGGDLVGGEGEAGAGGGELRVVFTDVLYGGEEFMKHYPGTAPTSSKQYQRDLYAFRHLGKDPTKPDKRERFIVFLLRWAADKKYTNEERMSIAKLITELVLYLQEGAEKNHGHPIEITRSVWQHCKDGTKERVAVTDIDKFFDQLDERLARSA